MKRYVEASMSFPAQLIQATLQKYIPDISQKDVEDLVSAIEQIAVEAVENAKDEAEWAEARAWT